MAINIRIPEHQELKPRILVFGIGGAGGNAVNNMMLKNLEGAEFVAANTDAQALQQSNAQTKLQLGLNSTQGLGAGAKPEVGNDAAVESTEQIADILEGANLCFITAGKPSRIDIKIIEINKSGINKIEKININNISNILLDMYLDPY